jgi:hypothetical protein
MVGVKALFSDKLTKKFFMKLPEGLYLVSNLHKNLFQSMFGEEIAALGQREKQWKRIVEAGVSQKLCYVFKTKEDYEIWLGAANYFVDKDKEHTFH